MTRTSLAARAEQALQVVDDRDERLAAEFDARPRVTTTGKPLAGFQRADSIEIKPVDWLIEGWVARDTLAGMVGPSGSCKSFLALDWACCVATGTSWNGCSVAPGAVFILAGEGRNGLRKRIEGWSVHHGVSITGAPLYLAASLPKLTDQSNAGAVIAEIDLLAGELERQSGSAPSLVIIDTVARAMAGDNENAADVMGALVECMDWLRGRWPGCVVLSVHHTGHDAQGRARGSSAYYAALDSEVVLTPGKSGAVKVLPTKCKDWQPPMPLLLARHAVDIKLPCGESSTSTLVLIPTASAAAPPDPRRTLVRELNARGFSQRKIVEQTGIPKTTVARLLSEQTKPVWMAEFDDHD